MMREPGHPGIRRRLNESAVCIWQEREQTIQRRENEVDSREQPQQRLERYFQRNQTSENTNPTASILMIFVEQVSHGKLPQRRHADSIQIRLSGDQSTTSATTSVWRPLYSIG